MVLKFASMGMVFELLRRNLRLAAKRWLAPAFADTRNG